MVQKFGLFNMEGEMIDTLFSKEQIRKSKNEALEKIKQYLDAEDIEGQFSKLSGNYYGSERFLVSWNNNYNGMAAEYSINKIDAFYTAYSGYVATYSTQGLLHEKQIKGYQTFERALCDVGLKLCPNKKAKQEFFNKYVARYNAKISKNSSKDTKTK